MLANCSAVPAMSTELDQVRALTIGGTPISPSLSSSAYVSLMTCTTCWAAARSMGTMSKSHWGRSSCIVPSTLSIFSTRCSVSVMSRHLAWGTSTSVPTGESRLWKVANAVLEDKSLSSWYTVVTSSSPTWGVALTSGRNFELMALT